MDTNKNRYNYECDLGHPQRCDGSTCHKCGFNPIEKARRKSIINNNGLSIVKKINGIEYYGFKERK